MTVVETLGALGSWSVTLSDEAPIGILGQLGYFGHIALFHGRIDVTSAADTDLLQAARYVGVLREKASGGRALSGNGMLFWLGDEDHKGKVFETNLVLTAQTLTQCLTAILPPSVTVGTVHDPGGTYTGTHQWQTPRDVLDVITTAFGVEYRVNGDGSLDVGTAAQLYNMTAPDSIVSARGAGSDFDLRAIGGTFATDTQVIDYSTRIVLLGQATDGSNTQFATGTADAPSVPYKDIHGHPVAMTRMISESGQTAGSVAARAQLQLNRFNRTTQALTVTAADYEMSGNFVVGDNSYVYDPDNGIYDASREVTFRGEVLHPAVVRISGITWPVTDGHTVAFRTQDGVWIDLTRWVVWESGTNQVTVGDLPKTLTSGSNPVLDQTNSAPDASIPGAPTALTLTTTSVESSAGQSTATITASWTAPALNTDGSVITDLSYYEVRYRWRGRAPLWDTRQTATTTIDIHGLAVGLVYDVEVAAVDLTGHVSAFTSVASITAAPDQTPPNAPSDPTVGAYLGQLRISWDGKDNTGAAMPPDFAIVEVHVSATSGFAPVSTPGSATLVDQLSAGGVSYATAPYGATRYVKLVAVDNSGNHSAPSGQVAGNSVWINTPDYANLSITDAIIANLSVGKLTAGTMSADVVIGGRFTTSLTGARVEHNSLGFQGFLADGVTKWLSLTPSESLLTGTFKTAASGRRIVLGAAGTQGQVWFYAPDNTATFINAWTETAGVEAIQFGVGNTLGTPNTASGLWNRINYNTNEFANYEATWHQFIYGHSTGFFSVKDTTNKGGTFTTRLQVGGATGNSDADDILFYWDHSGTLRFAIDHTTTTLRDTNSQPRIQFDTTNNTHIFPGGSTSTTATALGWWELGPGGTNVSAWMRLFAPDGFGLAMAFQEDSPGSNQRLAIVNNLNSFFMPVWGGAYTNASDRSLKKNIRDLDVDALDLVRQMRPRRFARRMPKGQEAPEEIGLVAQEAPEEIVRTAMQDGKPVLGIDLAAKLTVAVAAIQQLAERLDQLEGRTA